MEVQLASLSYFHNPFWAKWPMNNVDGCIMFFINNDALLIAYCFIEIEENNNIILIHSLEVHPEYQRRGIGSKIMNKIILSYPSFDFKLICTLNNISQSFWRSHGFVMLEGYGINCFSTPHLIRTKRDLSLLYKGNDPITKKYLGAIWSSKEKDFVPIIKQ